MTAHLGVHVLAVVAHAFLDLRGEFARRREDQDARCAVLARRRRCCGTSRCRIGSTKAAVLPVPVCAPAIRSLPARTGGNRLQLDGRGLGVPEVGDRAYECLGQAEGFKR